MKLAFKWLIDYFLPDRSATVQTLGHPAAGVIGWWDARDNTSGVAVNEDSALNFSAVWCATRIISETVATLPCILYRRRSDGGKDRARDDDRFGLVHDSPNEEQTAFLFFEAATSHLVSWGNAYSKVIRANSGFPLALEIKTPDVVTIQRDGRAGPLLYEITDPKEVIERPDMLHVPGLGFDGLIGYSVIKRAAQSIGTGMAAEQYAGGFFGNSAVPRGMVNVPGQKLSKEAREKLRREWNEVHRGSDSANKLGILHGGMEWVPTGMSHEDAQFLQSRRFSVEEIGRWYRLPLHMLGELSKATFSNIEQQSLEFVKYSMIPWLKRWEQSLGITLLTREERNGMFFEFLVDALLRGDIESRSNAYATGRQWGWWSVNDILQMENRNPVGPAGDVRLQPLNMQPLGTPPEVDTAGTVPESLTEELRNGWKKSLEEIAKQSQELRAELSGDVSVSVGAHLQRSRDSLAVALRGIRADRQQIKQEIADLGSKVSVSVTGNGNGSVKQMVEQAVRRMLKESLRVLLKLEAGQAVKAARRQVHENKNFLAWMEEFYEAHAERVDADLENPLAALSELGYCVENAEEQHLGKSKAELLACADGPPEGFTERVERLASRWQTERIDEDVARWMDG